MNTLRKIHCHEHDDRTLTYVCRHLVRGSGLGFYEPHRASISGAESDEQCAWCGECEQVRQRFGGWNDESEAFAGVTLICDRCFAASRQRNSASTSVIRLDPEKGTAAEETPGPSVLREAGTSPAEKKSP